METTKNSLLGFNPSVLCLLGFGTQWAWFALIIDFFAYFNSSSLSMFSAAFLILITAAEMLVMVIVGFFVSKHYPLNEQASLTIGSPVITIIGTIVMCLGLFFIPANWLIFAGAIVAGVGFGLMRLLWCESFTVIREENNRWFLLLLAAILSYGLFLVVFSSPLWLAIVFLVSLPLMSAWCIRRSLRLSPLLEVKAENTSRGKSKIPIHLVAYALICATPQGFYRMISSSHAGEVINWAAIYSCLIFLFLVVTAVDYLAVRKKHPIAVPKYTIAILGGGLMLALFLDPIYVNVVSFLILAGQQLSMIFIYNELGSLVIERKNNPSAVFARGMICTDVGILVGVLLFIWSGEMVGIDSAGVIAGLVYTVLFVGSLLLPKISAELSRRIISLNHETDSAMSEYDQIANKYSLTQREKDILEKLFQGHSQQYIAEEMHLSYNTIKSHVGHIYRKFKVHGRDELIQIIKNDITTLKDLDKE